MKAWVFVLALAVLMAAAAHAQKGPSGGYTFGKGDKPASGVELLWVAPKKVKGVTPVFSATAGGGYDDSGMAQITGLSVERLSTSRVTNLQDFVAPTWRGRTIIPVEGFGTITLKRGDLLGATATVNSRPPMGSEWIQVIVSFARPAKGCTEATLGSPCSRENLHAKCRRVIEIWNHVWGGTPRPAELPPGWRAEGSYVLDLGGNGDIAVEVFDPSGRSVDRAFIGMWDSTTGNLLQPAFVLDFADREVVRIIGRNR